ncbi:MAG: hypothetical protein GY953_07800 [bacterium]|nr:hypothetical protein [bacterium]
MTHRELVLAAVNHRETDRVPVDLGSTLASTMTIGAHERLREYLELPADTAPAVFSRRSCTVIPDEAILDRFDVDLRPVLLGAPELRPDRETGPSTFVDEWDVTWSQPEGGHFINRGGPFEGIVEPTRTDLDRFSWPEPDDPGRFRGLRERARQVRESSGCAVVLNLGVGPVHQCQFLRGYAEWLEDLLLRPAFAEDLIARVADFWIAVSKRALTEAGEFVDLVWFGDDIGTQKSTLIGRELYRQRIKPSHKRMVEAVKPYGKPVIYHSCGAIYPLIPDLIDVGIDVLNPIQVSAKGMDTARLKREYGQDLVFWGAIDSQGVLPQGTPADVREEVRRRIADLAPGGGYVLAAAHNIQADVPPENAVAMFEAAVLS